jgi:hypothetical protein
VKSRVVEWGFVWLPTPELGIRAPLKLFTLVGFLV